jgi:NAD(P)-dependent dehydrogenase (short-subunit alcohol dehydrogenase family)
MRLMNKVSIVTGAGRGIGEAIARRLSEEGAKVVISDVDMPAAENVARELKDSGREAIAIKANVANKAEVDEMVKKVMDVFGRVDILVNNAGMSVVGVSAELEESRWRQGIDVMLTGVFFCSQAAGKEMIKQRSGKIINIASVNGIGAFPERVCYSSAKAGVMQLTKVLGCEWARYNINVNAIAPGYVKTGMVADLAKKGVLNEAELATRTPLGRLAECEEIADAVVFLASEESKYIEGQTIVVDGGWSSYMYLESWLEKSKQMK